MIDLARRVLETSTTVLIEGGPAPARSSSRGRSITRRSARDKLFVAQNCAALAETLLESELFGHKKGAFTGAVDDKKGLFEIADGGTLFLDEIGETAGRSRSKLLRALQEGEIRPVGGDRAKHVNVRIVAATNRNLASEVQTAASARTSTTGSRSSRSACRRCASAARTSRSSRRISSSGRRRGRPSAASPPRRWTAHGSTGPETSASSST